MKVAICSPVSISNYSGAARILCEAARLLAQRGHTVDVYALPFGPHKLVSVPKFLRGISYYEEWKHEIDNADIVYVNYVPILWRRFHIKAARIAGVLTHLLFPTQHLQKTLLSPISSSKNGWFPKTILFSTISPIILIDLYSFNAIHIPNASLNIKHRCVFHTPLWVNAKVFKPCEEKEKKFTVLFVGRQCWEKGWETFQKIAVRLKGYGYNFISTGRGGKGVKGLGFLDDENLAKTYSKAHVTIYPSIADTFGLVIPESMACGTPVISTPIPAHLGLGLPILYATNVEDFVKKMQYVHDLWRIKSDEYGELCLRSYWGALKYDVEVMFPKFEDMLTEVASGKLFPSPST